jgi:hypothetical protein
VAHSAGFQHEVVRRATPTRLSPAEQTVADLGSTSGAFETSHLYTREDLARVTGDSFRGFDAVLFFTTGSLPLAAEARAGLLERIRSGGGFVGVHSATDTWYEAAEYGALVGGVFDGHPWHERVRVRVEDRDHPATRHLGAGFAIGDEIYQFRDWSRARVHVLLSLDPASVDLTRGRRADGDYALAWTRRHGAGRVFYTALGHGPDVWSDPRFREHLLGGIRWAMGGP